MGNGVKLSNTVKATDVKFDVHDPSPDKTPWKFPKRERGGTGQSATPKIHLADRCIHSPSVF